MLRWAMSVLLPGSKEGEGRRVADRVLYSHLQIHTTMLLGQHPGDSPVVDLTIPVSLLGSVTYPKCLKSRR